MRCSSGILAGITVNAMLALRSSSARRGEAEARMSMGVVSSFLFLVSSAFASARVWFRRSTPVGLRSRNEKLGTRNSPLASHHQHAYARLRNLDARRQPASQNRRLSCLGTNRKAPQFIHGRQ